MNPSPPIENESPPLQAPATDDDNRSLASVKNNSVSSITNANKVAAITNSYSPGSVDEYIIPGGISMLDISTRLRIKEAELNIVRRDFSELLAERNALESQSRRYEDSWKFTLQQLAKSIEQRNDAVTQLRLLEGGGSPNTKFSRSPEIKLKKMKPHQLRAELETTVGQLNTQTRVSRQLEYERDKANDEYEFAKAQLQTVILQNQDLLSACAEIARQRDKAITETEILKEELNRYDSELHNVIELELGSNDLSNTGELNSDREKLMLQQIKLLREQREHLQTTYQQTLDQYKRQTAKLTLEKRNATASADAMRALLQRRLETFQSENNELRSELRAAGELISQLKDQLAHFRLSHQSSYNGEGSSSNSLSHDDTPPESQSSDVNYSGRPGSAGYRSAAIHPLSQDTGMTLYNESNSLTGSFTSSLTQHSDLISPASSLSSGNYRVSSARTRRNHYIPTASPFPEESQNLSSSEDDNASWI